MAVIKVSPPPIAVRIVDENGMPTRELKEYLYRLWDRTANPAGNQLDDATLTAEQAADVAQTSIQLTGNATQQIQQLTVLFNLLLTQFNAHVGQETAHGSNGKIIGQNDIATLAIAGLVKKAASVDLPDSTTASTSATVIAAAPATYNQAHYQTVVDLLNSRTTQLNTLITDYNNQAAQLTAFRSALIAAGIM
ncbi:hypothetical protein [Arsukibacterium sp.]|uniref:hypothetical protein n=1 Tax=Arsukibacterium sp. TaxID=1977258 RepID=UPI002FDB0A87